MIDDRIDELASAYLDGELDAAELAEAEADPAVMARVARFAVVRARVRDVGSVPTLPEHRLTAVLTELTGPTPSVQRHRWITGLAATGVAAAVLAGVIALAATNTGDDSTNSADTLALIEGNTSDTTARQGASEGAQASPDAAADRTSTRSPLTPADAGATAAASATTAAAATTIAPAKSVPATAAATTKSSATTTVPAPATTLAPAAGPTVPDLGDVNDVNELTARLASSTTTSPSQAAATAAQPKPACATEVGATLRWRSQPAWLLVYPDRFDVVDTGCTVLASVARGATTTP